MSTIASSENKMGTMPVFKLILNMSLPIIFSMLVQAFITLLIAFLSRKSERMRSLRFHLHFQSKIL